MDPKDPLPHLLAAMVHMDRLQPVDAWDEARAALVRLPFAKSLNAVADNQRGAANVGYPLGFMGLENWARSTAYDSYDPLWGASHFFLSDRYPGSFDRRSELMQGFVTDPLAFGASNRYQSLLPVPGHHGTLAFNWSTSTDLEFMVPVVTLNGYEAGACRSRTTSRRRTRAPIRAIWPSTCGARNPPWHSARSPRPSSASFSTHSGPNPKRTSDMRARPATSRT